MTATTASTARSAAATTATETFYTTLDSPLGTLLLVGTTTGPDGAGFALTHVTLPNQTGPAVARVQPDWLRDDELFTEAGAQFEAYFAGRLTRFELPLRPAGGTPFRERVWQELEAIPAGGTTTYGALAAELERPPGAARAVGGAVGANPLTIVRPCHRVVGSDGSLTGFAGGMAAKQWLLRHEGALQDVL